MTYDVIAFAIHNMLINLLKNPDDEKKSMIDYFLFPHLPELEDPEDDDMKVFLYFFREELVLLATKIATLGTKNAQEVARLNQIYFDVSRKFFKTISCGPCSIVIDEEYLALFYETKKLNLTFNENGIGKDDVISLLRKAYCKVEDISYDPSVGDTHFWTRHLFPKPAVWDVFDLANGIQVVKVCLRELALRMLELQFIIVEVRLSKQKYKKYKKRCLKLAASFERTTESAHQLVVLVNERPESYKQRAACIVKEVLESNIALLPCLMLQEKHAVYGLLNSTAKKKPVPPNAPGGECANCALPRDNPTHTLKSCSRCKLVWYCSTACQTQHWKQGGRHKRFCVAVEARIPANKVEVTAPPSENDCVVCMDSLGSGTIETLACGHTLHVACVKCIKHFSALRACPVCRTGL